MICQHIRPATCLDLYKTVYFARSHFVYITRLKIVYIGNHEDVSTRNCRRSHSHRQKIRRRARGHHQTKCIELPPKR